MMEENAQKQGPRTLNDFCSWPQTVLSSLLQKQDGSEGERLHRLRNNLQLGLVMYTDYSGLAGEHEALSQMVAAMLMQDGLAPHAKAAVQHFRFCDHGVLQKKVLCAISALHSHKVCVMSDLNDRLAPVACTLLDSMIPKGKVPKEQITEAYGSLLQYLIDNREWLYPANALSYCEVHQGQCPLFPERVIPGMPLRPFKRLKSKARLDVEGEASDMEEGSASGVDQSEKLHINMAGTTCCGRSAARKSLHFADPSERPHAIWLVERMRRGETGQEDFFVSERTSRYPVQDKQRVF